MGNMRVSKRGYPIALVVFAVSIILTFTFTNDYYLVIMCQVACYYIAALGLNFITGLTGQPNMGAAGTFSLGAYTSSLVSMKLGVSPFLAMFFVLAMGWLIGKVLGFPTLRLEGVYLALISMLFAEVVRIVIMNMPNFTGGAAGLKNIPNYHIFGFTFSKYRDTVLLYTVFALIMTYIAHRITRSRWGRSFVAVRDNVEAVGSCGINVSAIKIAAYTVCCVFICVAGAMQAHYLTYLSPVSFSGLLSNSFVIILILGGIGTVSGAFVGSIIVVLLPEILRFVGEYYMLVYVSIVMLNLMFLPRGIVPTLLRTQGGVSSVEAIKMFFSMGKKGVDGDE